MTSFLKELSLALGLLADDVTPVANHFGWKDYIWRIRPVEQCMQPGTGLCRVVTGAWNANPAQSYDLAIAGDAKTNVLTVRLGLLNRDPADRKNICVVALFFDANDREMAIFYQNWTSLAGRSYRRDTPLTLAAGRPVGTIATVAVGARPCDPKTVDDSRLFYTIRTMIDQR